MALLSSMMAMLLQSLCARVGIATGKDLAQLCCSKFPRPVAWLLWILAEIAICATDLAELIGTAIALKLLFNIPCFLGVMLTALDAFLVLWLQMRGMRYLEAFMIAMIGLIAVCFITQIAMANPDWNAVLSGYVPSSSIVTNSSELYLAIGILGATVMPHNLYLHTATVQSRAYARDRIGRQEAIRFAVLDSIIALVIALLINSAILILSASAFHFAGNLQVADIDEAYQLINSAIGSNLASTLFALALLACGLTATVTATLSGQVVMEGFISFRLSPVMRRLLTRSIAIIPAMVVIWQHGESGMTSLLVLSQVILSLQLPFAIVPLMMFSTDRKQLGDFVAPRWQGILGWSVAMIIIALNLKLLIDYFIA